LTALEPKKVTTMPNERGSLIKKPAAMILTTGLLAATTWAQPPAEPAAPATQPGPVVTYVAPERNRPIRNAFRHAGHALQDGLVGYPKYFNEPPPGYFINQQYKKMSANANPHRFTIYRSDFLPGTDQFSPVGAGRFNLMASRLAAWQGAVMIEWSPDEPGLAEARRTAVIAILQRARLPITPERVVITATQFPGGLGADSDAYYKTMIMRDQRAGSSYTTSPTSASGFGGGSGSGSQ